MLQYVLLSQQSILYKNMQHNDKISTYLHYNETFGPSLLYILDIFCSDVNKIPLYLVYVLSLIISYE